MSLKKTRFIKGIILAPDTASLDSIEGEIKVDSADGKIKVTLGGVAREVLTNSQSQTLTNKTFDANGTGNSISNLETADLAAGVLNTSTTLSGASDTQLPSALAVKTYVDSSISSKDQADEILTNPSIGGSVGETIQDVLEDHELKIDDLITLSGVAASSTDLGSFTGVTIPDGSDVKEALQALETELETKASGGDFSSHTGASENVHGIDVGSSVVGTTDAQELTNKTLTGASIEEPIRSDVKQDTFANLTTYATTATNGQIVFATDEKRMFQVVDGELVSIGGAGIVKLTAGESISANDQVYISSGTGNDSGRTAGRLYKVDATNEDRVDVLGFATKAISSGAVGEVQTSGTLSGFSSLSAGKLYYASSATPGAISVTPPSLNSQWVISAGLAISSTELLINPVASASAIYITDSEFVASLLNNQSSATDISGLLFDPLQVRAFIIDYSIYREDSLVAKSQIGQIRGTYNTKDSSWLISDSFTGENAEIEFSIQVSGQLQYTSSNFLGTGHTCSLKYEIKKTFTI
jgi:hypothetical protein